MKCLNEAFEEYWNRRVKYRHPEENKKELKIFAFKMFKNGWEKGVWELKQRLRKKGIETCNIYI
jgi:hypothetical protein